MENYFKRNKKKDDADAELEKQIEQELLNYSIGNKDTIKLSDLRDDLTESDHFDLLSNKHDESFSTSLDFNTGAWAEFKKASEAKNQILNQWEENIVNMKLLNQNQFLEYDAENDEIIKKTKQLKNIIFDEDKLNMIKKKVQSDIGVKPEFDLPKFNETSLPHQRVIDNNYDKNLNKSLRSSKVSLKNGSTYFEPENDIDEAIQEETKNIERRMELARMDDEILKMEKEDIYSQDYEVLFHKQRFADRLKTLPKSFKVLQEEPSSLTQTGALAFIPPKFNTVKLMAPISKPNENLAEWSKSKMQSKSLSKIVNPKLFKIPSIKVNAKDQLLLRDSKTNILGASKKIDKENTKNPNASISDVRIQKLSSKSFGNIKTFSKLSTGDIFYKKIKSIFDNILKFVSSPQIQKILKNTLETTNNLNSFESYSVVTKNDPNENPLMISAGSGNGPSDNKTTTQSFKTYINQSLDIQLTEQSHLEIKLENIDDLKGIENMAKLRFLFLSMNKIKEINPLQNLKKLVEIHLAQNELKTMKGINDLKNLRFLNLELNHLSKIDDLKGCINLETLILNNNQISQIEGLQDLKKLKKLLLFRNKITKISGLDEQVNLQELDLGRNLLINIEGLQSCIMLRKLILYHNKIEHIPTNFSHLTLIELWLNANQLIDISNLTLLPSLEMLILDENQLQILYDDNIIWMPNLKKLTMNFNKISSIYQIYKFTSFLFGLRHLEYTDNLLFKDIPLALIDYYENTLINLLKNLEFINGRNLTKNQNLIADDLHSIPIHESISLIHGIFSKNLLDYRNVERILNAKFSTINHNFFYQREMALTKIINDPKFIFKLTQMFSNQPPNNFIYHYDNTHQLIMTDSRIKQSIYKVKSFLIKLIYKKRKIKKLYEQNIHKIIKVQSFMRGCLTRKTYNIRKIRLSKQKTKELDKLAKYAIKIQKVFRGYRTRRRKKEWFNNIKFDVDHLEEFDDSIFKKDVNYEDDFQLKIPDNIDIMKFLNVNQQQQPVFSANSMPKTKDLMPKHQIQSQQMMMNHPSSNNNQGFGSTQQRDTSMRESMEINNNHNPELSMISEHSQRSSASSRGSLLTVKLKEIKKVKTTHTEEEKLKLFEEWGLEKPEARKAFEYKLEKEYMRQKKKNEKKLTAAERYQLFLKNKNPKK